jgi:hypothetical protein
MDVNPFAPSQVTDDHFLATEVLECGVWRYDDLLIVGHNAILPSRCVKCNAPTDLPLRRMRLTWYSPFAYLGLLLGVLPFVMVVVATQRQLTVNIGVCREHRNRARMGIVVGVLGGLLAFALVLVAVDVRDTSPLVAAAIVFSGSLVACLFLKRTVWPKRIEDTFARIKGVCPEFLSMLPEAPL